MTRRVPMIAAILASAALTVQAGEITLYESAGFGGRNVTLRAYTPNVGEVGFNDRASSLVVLSGRWEVCTDASFGGYCTTLAPGEYRTLDGRLNNRISSAREVGATPADADNYGNYGRGSIELFGQPEFNGRSIRLDRDTHDLSSGFGGRATSVVVHEGSWELCSDAAYGGTCRIYAPGRYDDLGYGMAKAISSARLVRSRHVAPFVHGGVWGGAFTASQARARVILYEGDDFRGRSMAVSDSVFDLRRSGFGDETMSAVVEGGNWLICADPNFRGQCRVMGPGQYSRLDPPLLHSISSLRPAGADGNPANPSAPGAGIELFADSDFGGRRLALSSDVRNLGERDFYRQASSLTIWRGHWEVCTELDYGGRCAVFEPGRYANLYGLNDKISSIHQVY